MTTAIKSTRHRLHYPLRDSVDELSAERVESILDRCRQPLDRCRWSDLANATLEYKGQKRSDDIAFNCRQAFSTVEGTSALLATVNTYISQGRESQPDSTLGWTSRQSLPNFLSARFAHLDRSPRLEQVPRGDMAPSVRFRMQTESGFSLARFGCQFVLDETDMFDERTIGLQMKALEEVGRSASRLVPDLVYAKLLANPTMEHDSTAVFHADHGNLSDSALASGSLQSGASAIASQTLTDADMLPHHLNLEATYLLIPPALSYTALSNARAREVQEQTLEVRTESRLSGTGSYDPTSSTLFTGSDSNWLLAAPSTQRPSVIAAARDGVFTPRVRSFTLEGGRWGIGFDCSLDLAVCIADYRGLYWSSGTA